MVMVALIYNKRCRGCYENVTTVAEHNEINVRWSMVHLHVPTDWSVVTRITNQFSHGTNHNMRHNGRTYHNSTERSRTKARKKNMTELRKNSTNK